MAHGLQHLHSPWAVEKAITGDDSRVLLLRFGHDYDPECKLMDDVLLSVRDTIKARCEIFLIDISEVPDFAQQQGAQQGRHVQLELGLGECYKITWPIGGQKDLVAVVEAVHRGAQQGRDLIVAPQDHSLSYRY
ncbi:unnamed protein product [Polarella glacialis]|uniref:Thioredoxin-like protein 4A n=1 Tax=Polarella glacialis TaxID=89957 RepID=A0A813EEQ4_POLGL|nr:unnamed protein product [Polarella glacialis]